MPRKTGLGVLCSLLRSRRLVSSRNMNFPASLHACFLSLALVGASCSNYAVVSERKAVFRPLKAVTGIFAKIQGDLVKASHLGKKDPFLSLGDYLDAARLAEQQLQAHPDDASLRYSYNFAVARIFSSLRKAKSGSWAQPLRVKSDSGEYVLDFRRDKSNGWNPGLYDFKPADEIQAKGLYITEHNRKEGIGAPLVAVGKQENPNARADFERDKMYYGLTAVANFQGQRCVLSLFDPLAVETVDFHGKTWPLAADYTTPMAVMLAETNPKSLELPRLLRPLKFEDTTRIYRMQPYDPNKTVVLVIHGLQDSSATWSPMINTLRVDEHIRKNFQFWLYSYPSGYPYPHSAALLRKELDAVEKTFPLRKPMVVIGHSMGGCISRLLMTDTGGQLWLDYFGKPPAETQLSPKSRRLCEEWLIFRHRPKIGRVIYISSPLKGSDLAGGWFGRAISRLVKLPVTLVSAGHEIVKALATDGDSLKVKGVPNSVDTLSPNNRFVQAINKLPLTPGIPYHTIMGDRGKGGNLDHTPRVQSDGVVPYWSSHMEGAQSELVVPSGHSAHQNAAAIKEVDRILRLHNGH